MIPKETWEDISAVLSWLFWILAGVGLGLLIGFLLDLLIG